MRSSLQTQQAKVLFLAACLGFCGLYLFVSARSFQASRLSRHPDLQSLERAARLEPGNGERVHQLGTYFFIVTQDIARAVENYRSATALNPHEAQYWLDLASAYQVAGEKDLQQEAMRNAGRVDPRTPDVASQVAAFYVAQGDTAAALPFFHSVVENDPAHRAATLMVAWRATSDINTVLNKVLPNNVEAHLELLKILVDGKKLDASEKVWAHLMALQKPFTPAAALPYLDYLLAQGKVVEARSAWGDLAKLRPDLVSAPKPDDELVNGGFEQDIMNGGLDWQVHPAANVATEIDTEVFHSGNRSLLLAFNGQSADEAGISQSIPVQPNTRYELSCYVKSESLEGASGPRFAVSDAYTGASYLLADEFDRSATWRAARSEFQTGPDTKLVRLRIVRVPGNKLMRGRMWIDDVSLLPKGVSRDVQKDVANVSSETSPKMGAQ